MLRLLPLGAMAIALPGCMAGPAPVSAITGSWGGEHIGLVLDSTGGTLAYDCAAGRIDGPLDVGADGVFTASGSHTPGTGGPDRIDAPRASYPARYTGRIEGGGMSLRVSVPTQNLAVGPFTLRRGAEPQLLRCL